MCGGTRTLVRHSTSSRVGRCCFTPPKVTNLPLQDHKCPPANPPFKKLNHPKKSGWSVRCSRPRSRCEDRCLDEGGKKVNGPCRAELWFWRLRVGGQVFGNCGLRCAISPESSKRVELVKTQETKVRECKNRCVGRPQ